MPDKIFYNEKLFSSRDYGSEAIFLSRLFASLGIKKGSRILDIGSNNGLHASLLSKMSYEVIGIDSNPDLIKYAQKKVRGLKFISADMKTFVSEKKFDAAICIFNGIYFNKNKRELLKGLRNICKNLRPGGLLIFDINTHLLKDNFINNRMTTMGYNEKGIQIARFSKIQKVKSELLMCLDYLVNDKGQFHAYSGKIKFGFFSISEIVSASKNAGFKSVKVNNSSKFRPSSTYFICVK